VRPVNLLPASRASLARRTSPALALAALAVLTLATAQAATVVPGPSVCGDFPKADNGPHDYRVVRDKRLAIVEQYHFTPGVETLARGSSSEAIGSDLTFTLRAFPNHHRALLAMVRLSERLRSEQPPGSAFTVDCWLERSVRFAPDDTVARMIYANYLRKRNRSAEALAQMDRVEALAGDSPFTHYNAGLLLVEMKQFDRALAHAHKAYALGFQRTELRDKLQGAGQWKDAPPPAASAASAASAAEVSASAPALMTAAPAASAASR
jgi:tetratricopeptide (TPR) repeat protein